MPTSAKVAAIDHDLILELVGSPEDRSVTLAAFAREQLADADAQNLAAFGRDVPHVTTVDGAEGVSEDNVKPDGVIVYEFKLAPDAAQWVRDQLVEHSPVGSVADRHPGLYEHSHSLEADGELVAAGAEIPIATEYVFVNTTPYAGKIERGESRQAPAGVYEGVAALAAAQFGEAVDVSFEFRATADGLRAPAIVLTAR